MMSTAISSIMRNSSSDYTSFELCTVFDSFLYITFFSHVHLQLGVFLLMEDIHVNDLTLMPIIDNHFL
jgi:hypothetical protein